MKYTQRSNENHEQRTQGNQDNDALINKRNTGKDTEIFKKLPIRNSGANTI